MFVDPSSISAPQLAQHTHKPALSPPTGVVPDLGAHNDRADLYIIICAILLAIVYLFVSLRMYSKIWLNRTPGLDDGKTMFLRTRSLADSRSGSHTCNSAFTMQSNSADLTQPLLQVGSSAFFAMCVICRLHLKSFVYASHLDQAFRMEWASTNGTYR